MMILVQNMFVYQLTLNAFVLKEDKGNDYIFIGNSKGVYTSKLKP